MFIVNSVNGELYKLRASDAKEQQFWINQLQACSRRHSDSSAKVRKLKGSDEHLSVERAGGGQEGLPIQSKVKGEMLVRRCSLRGQQTEETTVKERTHNKHHDEPCDVTLAAAQLSTPQENAPSASGRTRSFSLLPHLTPSSSPVSQRHLSHSASPSNIVTITHHKSPAAARRIKNQYPGRLLEVKEVMSQAEVQQKSLVQSIDSLPTKGPLSCLDQDLLLLKATSAATLSCLGECLNILQQTQSQGPPPSQASQCNHSASSGECAPGPALLEPPTHPSPLSPLSPCSEPCPGGKSQLGHLDCGSCPCLMTTMNFNICSKCC